MAGVMRGVLRLLQWLVWAVMRGVLGCRYRVRLQGLEQVRQHPGPYLILPNHPAYADPPLVIAHLWPVFHMRPVLLESNFRNPLLAPFRWLFQGISVPDVTRVSQADRERLAAATEQVIAALRAGQNVVLWPSGRLSRDGSERLGGARLAADVLAAVPDVTIVLVRTRGLWGSMYSWADGPPPLLRRILQGLFLWIANLFVFAPRRNVTMTVEAFPPQQRPQPQRELLNPWLEAWYNADVPREEPVFVPHHFWFGPRTHVYPPPQTPPEYDLSRVRPATKQAIAQLLEEKLRRPLRDEENRPETTFQQLGIDSLDVMELTLAVERQFGFSSVRIPERLGELWALAEGLQEQVPPPPPPAAWFRPPSANTPLTIVGQTVPEAFVRQALECPRDVIVADDRAGVLTYERLLAGAAALATRFRTLPQPRVGLMLPASVGCDLALMGLSLAGKVPVLLNWTTGEAMLAHAVRLTGIRYVVSARAFVDRVGVAVPGAEYIFLEDLRGRIGYGERLGRLLLVRLAGKWYGQRLLRAAATAPEQTAVILFTSGSEKAPKAVPLSHRNILADQRACLQALQLTRSHSALGFLPIFHSFGLTITGLLPLFTGVKIVHHPDPTDAAGLVRKIAAYRPTIIATTPTFLSFLLDRTRPGDLDSLRLILVGAEACPRHLFERVRQLAPQAELLEGYGVTECSPVVTVNRPGRARPGSIGEPLPGVEVRIVDPDTLQPLPPGQRGMLLVSGPNVFDGYLGGEGPPPFVEQDGRRWYITGDLAERTADGYVVFHGRLKRFLKAGGEMISLPALEEPFVRRWPPTPQGPRAAVEGIETPQGRRIVLFTTEPISLREANAILQQEGFRGVMRLDDVQRLDAIPVLGNGKPDYKQLRRLLEAQLTHAA